MDGSGRGANFLGCQLTTHHVTLIAPGTLVHLNILREGHEREIDAMLGKMTSTPEHTVAEGADSGPKLGVMLEAHRAA